MDMILFLNTLKTAKVRTIDEFCHQEKLVMYSKKMNLYYVIYN